ncbi:hypothetical protein [Flavobacterium sp. NRK1]|uniref:hypothetical protein n=1 Tax=Flavobacterium sp. NRK1 TaxID=2954929 RepID=UPI0020928DF2|nr:hypothetical protein [Flavobacterium sp. NRK1]MCO6147102.1 hypothetical protein [Flavobacterium sp. NRK1]
MKNLFFLVSLITSTSMLTAQERLPLKGKLKCDLDDLEGIYVINKATEATVTTTRGGYFTISAKINDTIIFSAVNIIAKNIVLEEADVKSELLIVPVDKYVHELDELVIIDYSYINAESLGLVPIGQKQYTPGERRVYTATNGVDGIFNAISGRTKMLKKANETAKKEALMEKINYIYTEEELITKFHIPKEYLKGFVFYLVEDANFARALKSKNYTMSRFLMSGLSNKYLELIKNEK